MMKRDIQLRAQLEKRYQYFEEKIRKIYIFMDKAIKQRDDEWNEELEKNRSDVEDIIEAEKSSLMERALQEI